MEPASQVLALPLCDKTSAVLLVCDCAASSPLCMPGAYVLADSKV